MVDVERPKVTGSLIERNDNGMYPPDARVSQTRFFSAKDLFSALLARLSGSKKVTVAISPADNPAAVEEHEVFKSD